MTRFACVLILPRFLTESATQEYHNAIGLRELGQGLKDAATRTTAKTATATGAGAGCA
jgi:hypothetical protein